MGSERAEATSSNYIIRSLIAGGIAGCAAKTTVAPLDRVKILFQTGSPKYIKYAGSMRGTVKVIREIWQGGGVRGLFQGHAATLLRIFPYASIKFMAYEQFKVRLMPTHDQETAQRQFLAGSMAGIASVMFTYPMEVVRVRMAYDTRDARVSLVSTFRTILHEGAHARSPSGGSPLPPLPVRVAWSGLHAIYRGITPTILGMIPYAGVSFSTHYSVVTFLRHHFPSSVLDVVPHGKGKRRPMKVWAELTAGGISGMLAQTCSYPLEVVRRRMQVSGAHGGSPDGIIRTARAIWAANGFRGFYIGLSIGYVKVVPMVAVSFATYERMKHLLSI